MRKIIHLILFSVFLYSCQKSVLEKLGDHIEQREFDHNTILLSDFTDFKWDTVWIINSQMKGDYLFLFKEKNIDTKPIENKLNRDIGIVQEFSPCIFIFTLRSKIVHYEFPPIKDSWNIDARSVFYVSTLKGSYNYIILEKDKAIFKCERGSITPVVLPD